MKTLEDTFIYKQKQINLAWIALFDPIASALRFDKMMNKLTSVLSKPEEPHADR